ncbi:hypothetical protein [Klebsiella aerogenes EA1509E]|nr:hypothetical protein [Klebsiella aerogenes EA1509E]
MGVLSHSIAAGSIVGGVKIVVLKHYLMLYKMNIVFTRILIIAPVRKKISFINIS